MGIQVIGHTSFLGHTGYNNHSKNFFTNLNNYIPTRVRNYTYSDDLSYLKPEESSLIIEQKWRDPPYKIGTPFVKDPSATLVNLVLNESNHYYFYDKYESPMIAYNVWEATKQNPEYFNRILEYDQFWCPTLWQRQCTIDQGYPEHRVKVVPEGVNGEIFCPPKKSKSISEKKKLFKKYSIPYENFTFMIFGRWDYRKSTTEMVQAFCEEFKDDDKVTLILSADNPFSSDGMETTEQRLSHYKFPTDKIKVVHFPARDDYIKFMQYGNCLLSCSRSEGWNLPLMEALACGTPSVASNWGGHLEFAEKIAHLVDVPKELPPKEMVFMDNTIDYGVWGEPDFDHMKSIMRNVYNNYSNVKEDAIKKSKLIRTKYTWNNAAKIAETYIKDLCENIIIPQDQKFDIRFNTTFEVVDGDPRVIFNSTTDFVGKVFVVIQSENEEQHYEEWFNIKPGVNFWIALNNSSNKIKFEIFNESLDLLYSETKLVKDIVNIRKEEKAVAGMELYQDQIVNNKVIVEGKRECASRYEAMKRVFDKYKRPFTILDIGANFGYYSIKAATDYDAIAVMVENKDEEVKTLVNLCDKNNCRDKLIVLKTTMDIEKLEELNKCEHFDVVLALNVIHHFPKDQVSDACRLFTKLGDNLILETPPLEDHGSCGYENLDIIGNYFNEKQREKLGSFNRHTSETLSDMVWFQTKHDSLKWPYYGYERLFENKNLDVKRLKDRPENIIKSDFNSKSIITRGENRVWISGINLRTYLELHGEYPIVSDIIENIKNRNIVSEYKWNDTNNDLTIHNLILHGSDIHMIDFDDKRIEQPMNGDNFYLNLAVNEIKEYLQGKKIEKKLKLNLGCGNDIRPDYINIDKYNNTGNVDYQWDLSKLEVEDETIDEIFTSHVFEHIGINDIYSVVEEWRRALKPGGDLIMRLPNLEHEVNIWLNTPDDKKWLEVSRIFGTQSHEGNTHFCGFNPTSLKSFIEKFDFEVLEVREQNIGHGNEIYIHARKIPKVNRLKVNYSYHFVEGPFLEITGPESNNFFIADFLDPDNNSAVHQHTLEVNRWTRPHRKYFTNWLIQVKRNGVLDFEHQFNLKGKKVLISFDSKSLGDTLAWIPACEEFRKKHECTVWVSTFWNKLFDKCGEYKQLNWIPPGSQLTNLYASYMIGCYDGDQNKNKVNWRTIPLQQVAFDTLGLEYKETVANVITQSGRKLVTEEPYIAISEFSTFQCKFWNYPGGWQEIVNYLNDIGYKVVVISKEKTKLKNIINRTNRTMAESINTIKNAKFFMGVSAGPSWLAWALKRPVVLISGYSKEIGEFETNIERVINKDVCHGCFNDVDNTIERGNWNWCPRHEGTPRQFECTKNITPDMVKHAINEIIKKNYSRID